jgi:hypothetical protein
MTRAAHRIYIGTFATIILATLCYLIYFGTSYYATSMEERFYHDAHKALKPSGSLGHGYGIIGTLLILIGVFSYMARKRWKSLARIGLLKHWLEFHIFLCILGPILILFHTAFKFGGIVSVSFWSMIAVVASGVIGRYIYIQIPRSIQGRELSLSEVREQKEKEKENFKVDTPLFEENYIQLMAILAGMDIEKGGNAWAHYFRQNLVDRKKIVKAKKLMKGYGLSTMNKRNMLQMIKHEITMNRKIERLTIMQNLFKYWHIAHLPFAIIMLIIMIVHVTITLMFGYRWIF